MFCSYCIIPYARGPIRSRNIDNILAETDCLSKQGFKEIVLTGIHLGLYGYDFKTGQPSLLDVISKVSQVDGIERVRLSSIEPLELTDDLLKGVSKIGAFCRHFHIPLQSGSNTILKRMNRRYTTDDFQKRINHIRTIMPDVSITTDIIVGFPGESDSEFRKTERFISKLKFSKLHVFPFSPKKGTLAAKLPNQIRGDIKKDRSRKLILLSERLERDFREKFIGMEEDVLFEQEKRKNIYEGFTKNYIAVEVKSTRNLCNKIVSVRLNKNTRDFILGEIKDQYLFKEGNKPANVE